MIPRALCEQAFGEAVRSCDPTRLVHEALAHQGIAEPRVGLAVGKAAQAMARGLGSVSRGLCIAHIDDGKPMPPRWQMLISSHPLPDESSVAAGRAAVGLVESVGDPDTLIALISGGASSLMELPAPGITLAALRQRTLETMARGATIQELNHVRIGMSAIKGGKLADRALVPIITFVISDVPGDDPAVIGSGPTVRGSDRVEVIATLALFGEHIHGVLAACGIAVTRHSVPLTGDVLDVAASLAAEAGPLVAWGEPTVRLPATPGDGGRATQLALALAKHLRGSERSAFVAASDGKDANTNAAGAYVDGGSWDELVAAGLDPDAELARCNATYALARIGALLTPGPTGINHADVVVLG